MRRSTGANTTQLIGESRKSSRQSDLCMVELTPLSYGWMFWNGLVYSANLKTAAALASTTMQQADWDRVVSIALHPSAEKNTS